MALPMVHVYLCTYYLLVYLSIFIDLFSVYLPMRSNCERLLCTDYLFIYLNRYSALSITKTIIPNRYNLLLVNIPITPSAHIGFRWFLARNSLDYSTRCNCIFGHKLLFRQYACIWWLCQSRNCVQFIVYFPGVYVLLYDTMPLTCVVNRSWVLLQSTGQIPPAIQGATFTRTRNESVYLFGGKDAEGQMTNSLWQYNLSMS